MYMLSTFIRRLETCQGLDAVLGVPLLRKRIATAAIQRTAESRRFVNGDADVIEPIGSFHRLRNRLATDTEGHSQYVFNSNMRKGAPLFYDSCGTIEYKGTGSLLAHQEKPVTTLTYYNKRRHFTSSGSNDDLSSSADTDLCDMLLELHSVFSHEFSASEKVELLSRCHNNRRWHHPEFSSLMLEIWKNTGRLRQNEISIYHKICNDLGRNIFSGITCRSTQDPADLYEKQLMWDLNMLHNTVLSPTLEQYRKKQELINSLKKTLEKATNGTLHTFGSCENGLWVRGSDVDMCLQIPNCNSKRHWISKLHLIRSSLSSIESISHITIISAKVPIAKLYRHDNHNFCDISINNTVALDNTRFVKAMAQIDFRVAKLARFIKYWATCRCINNRSQGTLSSYTLILQLFYFLQNRSPPILPLYKDIELKAEDGTKEQPALFMTDKREILEKCQYLGKNTESLTGLLFEFFNFYSDKQFRGGKSGSTIDLYSNELTENQLGVLVMKCPITGKNVNPFTISMWQSIYREFKRVDEYIKEQRPISQLCMQVSMPPLEAEAEKKRLHAQMIERIVKAAKMNRPRGTRTLKQQSFN